jgi:hypothetical protein
VLDDYRRILQRVYDPVAYVGRINRLVSLLDRSDRPRDLPKGDARRKVGAVETVNKVFNKLPELRDAFWQTFMNCAKTNPQALRLAVSLMAMYLHLGPYSRYVIGAIDRRIDELDRDTNQNWLRYQSSISAEG